MNKTKDKAGATSQISGIIHAGVIFPLMYLFAPIMSRIPLAALAAVLIMLTWNMSNIRHLLHLFTAPRKDVVVLLSVFVLILSGIKGGPLRDLRRYHLDELIGEDHIFSHISSALEFARELLRIEKFKQAMR